MKILYVTRHFNHSGYLILERLISENVRIEAVLLHDNGDKWNNSFFRFFLKLFYNLSCLYYGSPKLKCTNSELSLAKKANIPIIWTKSIKSHSFYSNLKSLNPDIIVLGGGWHELIPERVFSFPKFGCINTHPSLLPEFRGTSITRWQILKGISKSGSSIHYVDNQFDTGGVIAQKELVVEKGTTPQELFYQLGILGADIMINVLGKILKSGIQQTKFIEHNPSYYKYFKKWEWSDKKLKIDWEKPITDIYSHIMANTQESYKYKGPFFFFNNLRFVFRQVEIKAISNQEIESLCIENNAYYIHSKDANGIIWICKKNNLYTLGIKRLQLYDKFYKIRRSYKGTHFIKTKIHSKINLA